MRVYHVPHKYLTGDLGFICTPVERHPRRSTLQPPVLSTHHFGPGFLAPLACFRLRRCNGSHIDALAEYTDVAQFTHIRFDMHRVDALLIRVDLK